ncbi:hypothetical protein OJF2_01490 [Aquisphaera giovannonii]|uniref:DUF1559 domain-containing protein n=1 Tax=Aquisphaera giovannonii TaxID=406548 RepID=A0A5B9VUC6_9BACT|nr:DUF1559 domain-containing protein [Aquisphaera giovannonii]QEH31684.1 hypothetical protein OJF2_01490 [Aquisphaera giovannonii]
MSTAYDNDPEFGGTIRKPQAASGSGVLWTLGCLGAIVLAVLFVLPGLFRGGALEAARRAQCTNNLKQIGLAIHNYVSDHGALPPACTVDANGRPLHSWRTVILPYLGEEALYRTIDLSKPWDDPANEKALHAMPFQFRCPFMTAQENRTAYLASVAPGGCLIPGRPRPRAEITDPAGATILAIEADDQHTVPWMAPLDADEALILGFSMASKLPHYGGVNAAMVDGSVKFLRATLAAPVRRALISASGGDGPADDAF